MRLCAVTEFREQNLPGSAAYGWAPRIRMGRERYPESGSYVYTRIISVGFDGGTRKSLNLPPWGFLARRHPRGLPLDYGANQYFVWSFKLKSQGGMFVWIGTAHSGLEIKRGMNQEAISPCKYYPTMVSHYVVLNRKILYYAA